MKKIAMLTCLGLATLTTISSVMAQNEERERRRQERQNPAPQRVNREERGASRRVAAGGAAMAGLGVQHEAIVSALWSNSRLLDEVEELGAEQKEKLVQLLAEASVRAKELRTQIETAVDDLERLLNESTVENVLVTAAVEKLGQLRTSLAKEHVRCYFALKQVLSPEQMRRLENLTRGKRERP
ncbi:MAG: periplasmic heavy metal sensor [Kiritimatiellae bacterium]|nr:periplasmic heavy metal sensor [Kiritimatiellia bacterium]